MPLAAERVENAVNFNNLYFDGIDDYVTIPDHATIQNIFNGGGSVQMVINPSSLGSSSLGRFFDKVKHLLHASGLSDGKIRFDFWQYFTGIDGRWSSDHVFDINKISNLAITYDNGDVGNDPVFYKDGSPITVNEIYTPTGTRESDAGQVLHFGNRATHDRAFHGNFHCVAFYSVILTAAEVLYNTTQPYNPIRKGLVLSLLPEGISGSNWNDSSGNGNNGTITGASNLTFNKNPGRVLTA